AIRARSRKCPTSCASTWSPSAKRMQVQTSPTDTGLLGGNTVVERVAFVGVGRMGGPMAARLLAAGHAVTVFDPDRTAVKSLVQQGAIAAASAVEAARHAPLVFASLPSPAIV